MIEKYRLLLSIYLHHLKWPTASAIIIILINFILAVISHQLSEASQARKESIKTVQLSIKKTKSMPKESLPVTKNPQDDFYSMLGSQDDLEDYLEQMFDIARKSNIYPREGTYRISRSEAGKYTRYHVNIPVNGSYRDIAESSETFLNSLQFSALEEIEFSRDNISHSQITGKLHFVLYLK